MRFSRIITFLKPAVFIASTWAMVSCTRPVTEKTLTEIGEFEADWKKAGLRLESWGHRTDSLESVTVVTTGMNQAMRQRYMLFRSAYDSVSVLFQQFNQSVENQEIGEEDTRKLLGSFQNNLADATERLDRWDDESLEIKPDTADVNEQK